MNLTMRIFLAVMVMSSSLEVFAFTLRRPSTAATMTGTQPRVQSNLLAARKTYWPVKKVQEYRSPRTNYHAFFKSIVSNGFIGGFASEITSASRGFVGLVVAILKNVIKTMISFISKIRNIFAVRDDDKRLSPFPPISKLAPAPASPVIPASQISGSSKMLSIPSPQPASSPSSSSSLPKDTTESSPRTTGDMDKTIYWPPKSTRRMIRDADKQYAQRVLSKLENSRKKKSSPLAPPNPLPSADASAIKFKYWPPRKASTYSSSSTVASPVATSTSSSTAASPVATSSEYTYSSVSAVEEENNNDDDGDDVDDYLLHVEVETKDAGGSKRKYFPPKPVNSY